MKSICYLSRSIVLTRCAYPICRFRHECDWKDHLRVNRDLDVIDKPVYVYLLFSSFLADWIGHINVVIIYCTISGLSCLLLWTFAKTFGTLLAFSIFYGFFGGAFVTLSKYLYIFINKASPPNT